MRGGVRPSPLEESEEELNRTDQPRKPVPQARQVDLVELVVRELDLLKGSTKNQRQLIRKQVERFLRVNLMLNREERISFFYKVDAARPSERKLADALGITKVGLMIYLGRDRLAAIRTYKVGENGNSHVGLAGMIMQVRSCEWHPTRERLYPPSGEEVEVSDGYLESFHQLVGDYVVEIPYNFRQCKYDRDRQNDERSEFCRSCRVSCPYNRTH